MQTPEEPGREPTASKSAHERTTCPPVELSHEYGEREFWYGNTCATHYTTRSKPETCYSVPSKVSTVGTVNSIAQGEGLAC